MRLIFMGTPEAAVPTLERCLADGHEIVAVWTQPDRPAGRGQRVVAQPVKELALKHRLDIVQPAKIRNEESLKLFASYDADAAIVVAYGRILPEPFLTAPRYGCLNVHFSLLPNYRGAAPVNWAIARGEDVTGVTVMQMDAGLDTGPILAQRETEIGAEETTPELMARLSQMGAQLLSETLGRLDELEPQPQQDDKATFAPLLTRADGQIEWSLDARQIERRVRGFQPWPNAFTNFEQRRLAIFRAAVVEAPASESGPGEIVRAQGSDLWVACGQGSVLSLLEVQPEGKRRMPARDFLNGAQLKAGQHFG